MIMAAESDLGLQEGIRSFTEEGASQCCCVLVRNYFE